jgi:hypothetical protein
MNRGDEAGSLITQAKPCSSSAYRTAVRLPPTTAARHIEIEKQARLGLSRRLAGMFARSRDFSIVAAVTVLGWVLYDLAIVATSPEPLLVRNLLPGCAAAVALGAAAGMLVGLHRALFWLAVLGAAAASAFSMLYPSEFGTARMWLPRSILLLLTSAGVAAWAGRRWGFSRVTTALMLGASAAVIPAVIQGPVRILSLVVLAVAAGGLAASWLPQRVRRVAAASAFALLAFCVAAAAYRQTELPRPDQPPPRVAVDPGRPNLLFIVLDTVRADHLAPYGYQRTTTPGLDAFAREYATRYTEANSASSWTLPSHGSLFTGLYPSEHGADHSRSDGDGVLIVSEHAQPLRPDVPTLAERLAAHGYQTAAIIGNSMYLAHSLQLDRGFAHYDDRWGPRLGFFLLLQQAGFQSNVGQSIFRSAETITDLALGWLAARTPDKPFFLFLNYMDAHVPYIPPSEYAAAFSHAQPADPYAPESRLEPLLYDRKLRYLDEHVARLLRALKEQHLLDDMVVIMGRHLASTASRNTTRRSTRKSCTSRCTSRAWGNAMVRFRTNA